MTDAPVLGVDVGGVIIDRLVGDGSDTSFFSDRFLETPMVADAFETIARLGGRFGPRIHVVSKCGPTVEAKTRSWLAHHGFHEATGVPAERLHFCRARADKGPICARLGVTHFVDDRLDVLGYLTTVGWRCLFGPQTSEAPPPADVTACLTWREVEAALSA